MRLAGAWRREGLSRHRFFRSCRRGGVRVGRAPDRRSAEGALHALGDAKLAAPILPSTILCAGSNYREHNDEKAGSPTSGKEPEFFVKTSDSVIGPDENIRYDEKLTRKLDCETELAVVIGKPGRHIAVKDALDHVFGYTIVNDVTARDRQVRKSGGFTWYELGRGKAFDTSAPTGPWIVTAMKFPIRRPSTSRPGSTANCVNRAIPPA